MTEVEGPRANDGWSKYPARMIVEEKSKVDVEQVRRMNEQLQAVCEVHAATSNALSNAEERNIKLRQEVQRLEHLVEALQEDNNALSKEREEQILQHASLKDRCIAAHERLGALSDYQMERSELLTQLRQQSEAIMALKKENSHLREEAAQTKDTFDKLNNEKDLHKRQADAQLRCNEVVTSECTRLKRVLSKNCSKNGEKEARIGELESEVSLLKKQVAQLEKDIASREKMAQDVEDEGRFLKRERVGALKALEDERDKAKERELLIRTLRRENSDLREQVAVLVSTIETRLDEQAAEYHKAEPMPIMEVGVKPPKKRPGKDPLLANLKQQNKLQMKSLTNTLQQLMYTLDRKERSLA
eukprot:TRINITY_DN47646_c0_g1_i1.p1 TRINITY_DN47646_c0_g1~~TRINITY_DN47646_c0_g1_i1.p1  ORF type:complete len:359 (+),score=197.44 TRINITY_DN47646_c0_g1_i1:32-1108(+)